jgi:hypothetical protein
MMRVTVETLLLFALPFAAYALWLRVARDTAFDPSHWSRAAIWLAMAGLALVALAFLLTGLLAERRTGGYVPAHVEDGRLVPGQTP